MGFAPVILVPLVNDLAAGIEAFQHIGPGAQERLQAGFLQVAVVLFVVLLREDRSPARLGRHVAEGGAGGKGELDAIGVQHLDRLELGIGNAAVFRDALVAEQFITEQHVLGRHGRAVREFHVLAQVEDHPGPILGVFHRRTKQAVGGAHVVGGAGQDGFVEDRGQRRRIAGDGIGVEAVKAARCPLADLATLWRVGVHIGQMREVGRKGEVAEGGNAVRHDHRFGPQRQGGRRQGQDRGAGRQQRPVCRPPHCLRPNHCRSCLPHRPLPLGQPFLFIDPIRGFVEPTSRDRPAHLRDWRTTAQRTSNR